MIAFGTFGRASVCFIAAVIFTATPHAAVAACKQSELTGKWLMNFLWMEPTGKDNAEGMPQMCAFTITDTGSTDFVCYDRFKRAASSYTNVGIYYASTKVSTKCVVSLDAWPSGFNPWIADYTWTGYLNTDRDGVVGNLVNKKTKRIFPFQMVRTP